MKNLVIVESPAKGKTIEKYLGKDFTVRASFGHIRDLPEKSLGVDIEKNFAPTYEVSEDKKKVVNDLKKIAKTVDKVWIATDPDREGEAIGWHLCNVLDLDVTKTSRVTYHEITKSAVEEAFKQAGKIDLNLVNAQQSRRVLDRLVGFKVSPVLWKKIRKGLSAGRVQSVAVKLIVEREREIIAFKPEESWRLKVKLEAKGMEFYSELVKLGGKNKKIKSGEETKKILSTLGIDISHLTAKKDKKGYLNFEIPLGITFVLDEAETKDSVRLPGAPFTTSTLQQEASRKLGFSVGQTMSVAQSLYQNGHITYMRTDSVNLSDLAIETSKKFIESNFGKEYTLPNGRKFKTKQANAQEAHEAIRPAYIDKTPDTIGLTGNDARLYKLIWERTVASQMKEALVETTTYSFYPENNTDQLWITKGEVIKFPGFMKLYTEGTDDEGADEESPTLNLPELKKGEKALAKSINGSQTFSKPPARYTEAALVKKLESEGIGRPSTYAPTITTIIDRGYVEREEKKLKPTEIAFIVNDFLEKHFPEMMNYKFTANVENEFDEVAAGKMEWTKMLEEFYTGFKTRLTEADETGEKVIEKVGRSCPECNEGELLFKYSKSGKFIGCNRFPTCKYIERITDDAKEKYLEELRAKFEGKPCEAGGTIVVKTGRFGPFLASSLYPEVKWIGRVPNEKMEALEAKFGGEKCDKCGEGIMHVKGSRRGPFLACSAYPECKNAKNLPKEASQPEETSETSENV